MPFSDYKTALVTGASGGMGRAIAERLSQKGLTVHAFARSKDKLEELASSCENIVPHAVDISDTKAVTAELEGLEIDVLVNCAGVSRPGSILQSDAFDIDEQIDVNLRACLHLARLLLPGMMERDSGHIVNISSMAGHYEFGGHIAYHATKAAMHTVSRQLRVDAFGRRVRVTELSPGRVETDIFANVEKISPEEAKKKYFEGFEMPQVSDIADAVDYAIGTPQYVNIGLIELLPTLQVPGGLRTAKRVGDEVILTGNK
ncbi:SDR family oxidoreductase [Phaeobacter sp. B1627]|uniref:SDR family oxidoreductase n=1 Tax=Phaeobacter sp. B1627 TaxID=2583809 RepID=UPI00111956EC|nr:SDR family oxidoreductase [Phaeobacter sp. B1627]TNJ43278.1 SDR family oxidoreductase [Phaeobacter sp. B1627]